MLFPAYSPTQHVENMALSSLLYSSWTLEPVRLLVSPDPVFWSEADVARGAGKCLTLCGPMELQDPVTDSSPESTSLLQCFPSTPDLQHGSSQAQGPGRGGATLLQQHLVWRVENSGACLLGGGGGKHNAVSSRQPQVIGGLKTVGNLSLFFFLFSFSCLALSENCSLQLSRCVQWNTGTSCPREAVDVPFLEVFKARRRWL